MYHQPNGGGWNVEYSDMLGPRYPDVDSLLSVADGTSIGDGKRPVVMGEYNHAMGNSLGLVHAMWSEHIQPPVRTASDETGNDNDGVLVGTPTIGIGEDGGAITLDDDDTIEVEASPSLDFEDGFTLALTLSGVDSRTERTLVSKDDEYALALDRGRKLTFSVHGGGRDSVTARLPRDASDGWHTLVATGDSDELALYLDGERLATTDHDGGRLPGGDGALVIGNGSDGNHHGGHHHRRGGHHHDGRHHHGGHHRGGHDEWGRDHDDHSHGGNYGHGHSHGHGHDHDHGHGGTITLDSVRVFDRPLSADEVSGDTADPVLGYTFAALLRDESLQGGFVWAWEDQAVTRTKTVDGEEVEYTFYDDNPFCLDGLVWADRSVQPDVPQLKHSHQPVKVAPTAELTDGEVYITNHFAFTDMRAMRGKWQLVEDDRVLDSGRLDLDLDPGETRRVRIPFEEPHHLDAGAAYRLNVSFSLREPTAYADAGHDVARDQLEIPFDVPDTPTVAEGDLPALDVSTADDAVTVSGDGFEYTLDTDAGTFSAMNYGGTDVVDRGPQFNAWRAPIMNEVQGWGSEQASSWYAAGLDHLTQLVDDVSVERVSDPHVRIDVDGFVQGAPPTTVRKTPDASATGSDGTLVGDPEIVSGRNGSAVQLDGDDYVDAGSPEALNFTSPGFTVSITFDGVETGGDHPLVAKGDHQYALKVNDDRFSFFIYDETWVAVNDTIPSDLSDGWHTLTGVCDTDELRLYLDGELFASRTHDASSVNGTDEPLQVAHNSEHGERATATTVDSVRVYDRALSADEVASQPDSASDDAVLWYGFDEFYDSQSSPRGHGFETTYSYHVFGSGDVVMDVAAAPNDQLKATVTDYLPKMGVQLQMPTSLDTFEWYGRGPVETYPDRRWGADIGRYSGTIEEQYVPYVPPTDNGNKAETRWAALANDDGAGLLGVATDGSMNVSTNRFSNLAEAGHQYELEEADSVAFNLDDAMTGVGGTPVEPYDEYQVRATSTQFSVLLRPFTADDGDLMTLANRSLPVDE
ncbi:hypothetical protein A4G99_21370 [Haladaptatus sp. R4]|nr:hypothetical protein A4G99_21370 [Haladaptatus sp. R4]